MTSQINQTHIVIDESNLFLLPLLNGCGHSYKAKTGTYALSYCSYYLKIITGRLHITTGCDYTTYQHLHAGTSRFLSKMRYSSGHTSNFVTETVCPTIR
jgi:hypothetical protein